ncbi:MAG: orotidine-5'-phosphate decarboxylase [Candidatus Magasanikbacteria bacterium]|nr:orotidine-5'-phosphate decarboxylase [Candidatus Magasanikbacteria bacterium]
MRTRIFKDLFQARQAAGLIACVGLDPDPRKMPHHMRIHGDESPATEHQIVQFLLDIVDASHDIVGTYKPNDKFYLKYPGVACKLIEYIKMVAPDVAIILDAKYADIGNTNAQAADFAYDYLGADAVTIHPPHGEMAMRPFLDREDKGVFVVCRTSNPGADEFQLLTIKESNLPLYLHIAQRVSGWWNTKGNCGIVVGGTCPTQEIQRAREVLGDHMPILMPGFGSQGGQLMQSLGAGFDMNGGNVLPVNASAIIHATQGTDYAQAARRALQQFNRDIFDAREFHRAQTGG